MRAISQWQSRGFEYGCADCCQFVDFVVEQLTGQGRIPWRYTTAEEANHIINTHGSLQSAVSYVLGDPVSAHDAQIGDPVLWRVAGRNCLEGLGVRIPGDQIATIHAYTGGISKVGLHHGVAGWQL